MDKYLYIKDGQWHYQASDLYCIYKHTNKINGKVYIGQTKNTFERWRKKYEQHYHFRNAIVKYGWVNFTHEILECNLTKEQANKMEHFYIVEVYKSYIHDKGYNDTLGGEGCVATDETKKKMSESTKRVRKENPLIDEIIGLKNKLRWQDEEYKKRTIEAQTKGKHESEKFQNRFTEHSKELMSQRKKELWNNPQFKKKQSEKISQAQLKRHARIREEKRIKQEGVQLSLF